MKAQARKILALIMAMVMCLSLAAPAFAASEEAAEAEASAPVVETVETEEKEEEAEAPKAEKKAKKSALKAQGDAQTTCDDKGNYTFADDKGEVLATGNVTGDKPVDVTVTLKTASTYLIGEQPTDAVYEVKYTGEGNVKNPTDTSIAYKNKTLTVTVKAPTGAATKTIEDVKDEMKPLTEAQCTFADDTDKNKTYQVKGSYYVESTANGAVNVYFRLSKYVDVDKAFDDSDTVDLVTKNVPPVGNDNDKLVDALKSAKTCNIYGETKDYGIEIKDAHVVKTSKATTPDAIVYAYTVINDIDVSVDKKGTWTGDTYSMSCEVVGEDKTTGTFNVRIENRTGEESKWAYLSSAEEVETLLKKALEGQPVSIESVVAAESSYFTVTVKKTEDAAAVEGGHAKNIMKYQTGTEGGKPVYSAVLIDTTKDGWYNGKNEKGLDASSISATTEATGPVVVRVKDIPTGVSYGVTFDGTKEKAADGLTIDAKSTIYKLYDADPAKTKVQFVYAGESKKWTISAIVFNSAADMKGVFTSTTCKQSAGVPYAELKMNAILNSKLNTLVTITKGTEVITTVADLTDGISKANKDTYVVAAKPDWYKTAFDTPNAAFVNKGSVKVEAKAHGLLDTVLEETAPTCQTPGKKTTKMVCRECKQVVSEKTEEIPAVTDPIEKYKADDPTQYAFPTKGTTNHYVAKQETVSATDTATGMITTTTTYTCNFGHVHTEMNYVETTKKNDLQHSARWDYVSVDKFSAFELWSSNNAEKQGMLRSVTVADTDIELTTVPMNRDTDDYFQFPVQGLKGASLDAEGKFVAYGAFTRPVEVYTSSDGLASSKYFAAQLTVKDIKVPATSCEDASCTVVVDVYEVAKKTAEDNIASGTDLRDNCVNAINAKNLEENLKNKKVTLVKTYTENVFIAGKGHQFFKDGVATDLCVNCGQKRQEETPVANVIDAANVTVKDLTYTGKVAQPQVIVKDADGFVLIKGTDYVVSEVTDTAVGEYTITIKGINEYAGNKFQKTFKIVKAAAKKQTLKVSVAKKTFKVKNLKKKKASFTTKLSGAKTAVTWKSSNAKVTVKGSKKKATITVKKGTKKGTYKVTATAKKTSAYKKGTVTVKVVVK